MATDVRGPAPPLNKQLEDEGPAFDFFQAVALLERLAGVAPGESVGAGGEPWREAVRFTSTLRMSFAATEITSVATRKGSDRPTMEVGFLGIAGAEGPLPQPFAELVMRKAARGDTAARDLLDVFNHRLISLAYRIRKRHRIGLGVTSPEQDDTARYLFALLGLGLPELRRQLALNDRSFLHHAGLFSREVRSMAGLEALLRWHFEVPVSGRPLTGGYFPIEPADRTTIGPSGNNRGLGQNAVLGSRYWDQEAVFDLRIGPISPEGLLEFLPPDGERLVPLRELVRFYTGKSLDFRLRLLIDEGLVAKGAAPPEPRALGTRPRLGYTASLGRPRGVREVLITSAAFPASPGA
jgi:type VI secretion system protein ImpH